MTSAINARAGEARNKNNELKTVELERLQHKPSAFEDSKRDSLQLAAGAKKAAAASAKQMRGMESQQKLTEEGSVHIEVELEAAVIAAQVANVANVTATVAAQALPTWFEGAARHVR